MHDHSLAALAGCIGIAICLAVPQAMAAQPQGAQAANAESNKASSSQDRMFVKEAAAGGLYEVQAGQLAAQKATNPEIKQMAQHIVTDHNKANNQLKAILQSKGMDVPAELDAKHQKKLESLNKLSGADFDREYASMMVSDHKEDIKLFTAEVENGGDPDLQQFAVGTLATLNQHLAMAQAGTHAAAGNGSETAGGQPTPPSPQATPAQRNDGQQRNNTQ